MTTIIPLSSFTFLNHPTPLPPLPTSLPFTLSASPITDLWRKPPNLLAANQPTLYTPIKLSTFISATASFRGDWKTLYDQAGLILISPSPLPEAGPPAVELPAGHPPAWIKSGIEFLDEMPNRGTVSAGFNAWADWSLVPSFEPAATVRFEREGEGGSSLQIRLVGADYKGVERKTLVREVTWVFEEALVKADPEVWVGVYVAKPTRDAEDEGEGDEKGKGDGGRLEVEFWRVEVVVKS